MNRFLQLTAVAILMTFALSLVGALVLYETGYFDAKDLAVRSAPAIEVPAGANRATAGLREACAPPLRKYGADCSKASDCCSQLCMAGKCEARRPDWARRDVQLNCALPGEKCAGPSQCCSNDCNREGRCSGLSGNPLACSYVDQYCASDSDCCSRKCNEGLSRCEPDSGLRECAAAGKRCEGAADCCSRKCEVVNNERKCLGSNDDRARIYEFCTNDAECFVEGRCVFSETDNRRVGRCLPK